MPNINNFSKEPDQKFEDSKQIYSKATALLNNFLFVRWLRQVSAHWLKLPFGKAEAELQNPIYKNKIQIIIKFYNVTVQEILWAIRKFNRFILNFMLGDFFFFLSILLCFIICNIQTFTSPYPLPRNRSFVDTTTSTILGSGNPWNCFNLLQQRDPALMEANSFQKLDFYPNLVQLTQVEAPLRQNRSTVDGDWLPHVGEANVKPKSNSVGLWFPPNLFFNYRLQACNNLLFNSIDWKYFQSNFTNKYLNTYLNQKNIEKKFLKFEQFNSDLQIIIENPNPKCKALLKAKNSHQFKKSLKLFETQKSSLSSNLAGPTSMERIQRPNVGVAEASLRQSRNVVHIDKDNMAHIGNANVVEASLQQSRTPNNSSQLAKESILRIVKQLTEISETYIDFPSVAPGIGQSPIAFGASKLAESTSKGSFDKVKAANVAAPMAPSIPTEKMKVKEQSQHSSGSRAKKDAILSSKRLALKLKAEKKQNKTKGITEQFFAKTILDFIDLLINIDALDDDYDDCILHFILSLIPAICIENGVGFNTAEIKKGNRWEGWNKTKDIIKNEKLKLIQNIEPDQQSVILTTLQKFNRVSLDKKSHINTVNHPKNVTLVPPNVSEASLRQSQTPNDSPSSFLANREVTPIEKFMGVDFIPVGMGESAPATLKNKLSEKTKLLQSKREALKTFVSGTSVKPGLVDYLQNNYPDVIEFIDYAHNEFYNTFSLEWFQAVAKNTQNLKAYQDGIRQSTYDPLNNIIHITKNCIIKEIYTMPSKQQQLIYKKLQQINQKLLVNNQFSTLDVITNTTFNHFPIVSIIIREVFEELTLAPPTCLAKAFPAWQSQQQKSFVPKPKPIESFDTSRKYAPLLPLTLSPKVAPPSFRLHSSGNEVPLWQSQSESFYVANALRFGKVDWQSQLKHLARELKVYIYEFPEEIFEKFISQLSLQIQFQIKNRLLQPDWNLNIVTPSIPQLKLYFSKYIYDTILLEEEVQKYNELPSSNDALLDSIENEEDETVEKIVHLLNFSLPTLHLNLVEQINNKIIDETELLEIVLDKTKRAQTYPIFAEHVGGANVRATNLTQSVCYAKKLPKIYFHLTLSPFVHFLMLMYKLITVVYVTFCINLLYLFTTLQSPRAKKVKLLRRSQNKYKFSDLVGVETILPDFIELVQFFKFGFGFAPSALLKVKYKTQHYNPKSFLFTGPPGTGKTLVAKALAGEAKMPYFYTSASEFVSNEGGLGPVYLRELFRQAKVFPSILFIDEMDVIGKRRSNRSQFYQKDNQNKLELLTEFLIQIDGVKRNNHLILIGATNFIKSLDSALIRPGRFDRIFHFDLPSATVRLKMLQSFCISKQGVNASKINSKEWVYFQQKTRNLNGADIAAIVNESLLQVIRYRKTSHTLSTLQHGFNRIITYTIPKLSKVDAKRLLRKNVGTVKKSVVTPRQKNQNSYLRIRKAYTQAGKLLFSINDRENLNKITFEGLEFNERPKNFRYLQNDYLSYLTNSSKLTFVTNIKTKILQGFAGIATEYYIFNEFALVQPSFPQFQRLPSPEKMKGEGRSQATRPDTSAKSPAMKLRKGNQSTENYVGIRPWRSEASANVTPGIGQSAVGKTNVATPMGFWITTEHALELEYATILLNYLVENLLAETIISTKLFNASRLLRKNVGSANVLRKNQAQYQPIQFLFPMNSLNHLLLFSNVQKRIHPTNLQIYKEFWKKRENSKFNQLKTKTDLYNLENEKSYHVDIANMATANVDLIRWRNFHLWISEQISNSFISNVGQSAWDLGVVKDHYTEKQIYTPPAFLSKAQYKMSSQFPKQNSQNALLEQLRAEMFVKVIRRLHKHNKILDSITYLLLTENKVSQTILSELQASIEKDDSALPTRSAKPQIDEAQRRQNRKENI